MDDRLKLTGEFVFRKIEAILNTKNESAAKATLANLRRGIGRSPGSMPELWDVTLEGMPEALLSKDGVPTWGEWATYTALTLFALHQQGHDRPMNCVGVSLGQAVSYLVKSNEDRPRIKRRFDAALTAESIEEFAYHIRGLIQLLKAEDISLDYPMLAKDLYLLQTDSAKDAVRLRWGQDFYRTHHSKDEERNLAEE